MNDKRTYRYWLHRVNHENGISILNQEKILTIGFSAVKNNLQVVNALRTHDWSAYCRAYTAVYSGAIERFKNSLWRFVVDMQVGDIVVVPVPYGFNICRIKSVARLANRGDADLGWERDVDLVKAGCFPRDAYATQHLLSRMKCRQINLCVDDLADDIDEAEERLLKERPYRFFDEMATNCYEQITANNSPEQFEQIVCNYFVRAGADAHVMPKNMADKTGDCDVEAVFTSLKLTISVQCKKHEGLTDETAVRQIADYDDKRADSDVESNWNYQKWVITSGNDFTEGAKKLAAKEKIILIAGPEFSKMLIKMGI